MLTLIIITIFALFSILLVYMILQNVRSQKRYQKIEEEIQSGQLIDAVSHLQSVVKDYPHDMHSLFKLANLQMKTDNYFDAVQSAKQLLTYDLKKNGISEIKVRILIAEGTFAMGNKKEALAFYHEALQLDPTNPEINRKLTSFSYENGNFDKAREYAASVIKFFPDDIEANLYSGLSSFQLSDYDAATVTLSKVTQFDPNNFQAAITLAKIFAKNPNKQMRDKYFKQALSCTGNNEEQAQTRLLWATTELKLKHNQLALEQLEKAIELAHEPNLKKSILREMIAIYEEEKNINKTIWAMKDFLKLEPENKGYRSKIEYYLELDANTKLQKYEMLTGEDFASFCKAICGVITKIDSIQDIEVSADNVVDILTSKNEKSRKRNIQFRFIRSNTKIGMLFARDVYEKMRSNKGEKTFVVANSEFTEDAVEFAQTREISLVNKARLLQYLDKLKD